MSDPLQIAVERTIEVAADALFDVLSDPCRHAEIDGSAMVRGDVDASRITGVGDVFTMYVHHESAGDYRTDNHVTVFVQDSQIAWRTAAVGSDPEGWEWRWILQPSGDAATRVTLAYDWSDVTDPDVLALVRFPVVSRSQLEGSLDRLETAAG